MKAEKTKKFLEGSSDWRESDTFKEIWTELTELERLAEIGKATELAFEKRKMLLLTSIKHHLQDDLSGQTVVELLEWAEREVLK